MKATGIVRRIDDFGRVVVPKEIRRTLRIREGDPLEIFVDREGEVILKKYSPISSISISNTSSSVALEISLAEKSLRLLNLELSDAVEIPNFSANLASLPNFSLILPLTLSKSYSNINTSFLS